MKVMVDAAGVCFIYFNHRQEIFIGYKNFIFMV